MHRLEVEHVRLNTSIKKPLQYLIIHTLCVHLKKIEPLTIKPFHQRTDGDRGYFKRANFLRIGPKSAVMLSHKARRRRGARSGDVKFYHTVALCHRGID